MSELTLAQAATLARKSKSTLTRAIKSGRMSASRKADGTFALDPAEVLRVFPVKGMRVASSASEPVADAHMRSAQQSEINALRDDLAAARQAAAVASALADERAAALADARQSLADLRRLLPPAASPLSAARPWWRFW